MQASQWRPADAAPFLSTPEVDAHKYSRGVLHVRTGSSAYPGAAVLSVEAAWRTGIGMVRYVQAIGDAPPRFGLPTPAAAILATRPETVFFEHSDASRARCDAWLIGSGTDAETRSFAEREALLAVLAGDAPVVVDAGALELVIAEQPKAPTIITPHRGEFTQLWRAAGLPEPVSEGAQGAHALANRLGVTVLLKGSRTVIATPSGRALAYGPATPWLATAGTGDVLAGVLGALVAANAPAVRENPELLAEFGATAAALHDTAARLASGDNQAAGDGHAITALDVATELSGAYLQLRG